MAVTEKEFKALAHRIAKIEGKVGVLEKDRGIMRSDMASNIKVRARLRKEVKKDIENLRKRIKTLEKRN